MAFKLKRQFRSGTMVRVSFAGVVSAGIPHFWRVENVEGHPTVYVYELDPATGAYTPTGIHHDRLKLTVPFDIDIDLTEIDRL